jgi:hypothetical protein
MKRTELDRHLAQLADRVGSKPFGYRAAQVFPVTWEEAYRGRWIQVEVERLELTEGYIHLPVAAEDGTWPSAYAPNSTSAIIRKAR